MDRHPLSRGRILLPAFDQAKAVIDNAVERLFGIDDSVGPLRKRIAQLGLHLVGRRTHEILSIRPVFHTGDPGGFLRSEEKQSSSGWPTDLFEDLEYPDMPDAVDDKVVAWLKTCGSEDIAAERRRIVLNSLLTQIL